MSQNNTLYPTFLKLDQINTLIIGGGDLALEKLNYILKSTPNAKITLIALNIDKEVTSILENNPHIQVEKRAFLIEDLNYKQLLVLAVRNKALINIARQKAHLNNTLVNVVDQPELSDFYLGSIVTRGDLKIAISTNGKAPVLAKKIREILEDTLPNDTEKILTQLGTIRTKLTGDFKQRLKSLNKLTEILTISTKEYTKN